jgi:hypothetical protein
LVNFRIKKQKYHPVFSTLNKTLIMQAQKYSVNQHLIEILLAWVKSGDIAIPEIQRPFVWDSTKVRDLIDSLYNGYPIGYIITWRNPDVRLKDGSISNGKKILIDGQQRISALNAAILGEEITNSEYKKIHIKIAFNPIEERFEVLNPAILRDKTWIPDISELFKPGINSFSVITEYLAINPSVDHDKIINNIGLIFNLAKNQIGLIELDHDLDIETVTEIFIRINSKGVVLSQADFAMSKIASNEQYDGSNLRKAIDYFSHMAVAPEFFRQLKDGDKDFVKTDYFSGMTWLKDDREDLYDPDYSDVLRVAFTSKFNRGRLSDLVSLLSGRNFETRSYEDTIAEESFQKLSEGVKDFMNETNFKRFMLIMRSAGFIDPSMIRSINAIDFAYILYLKLREKKEEQHMIESYVRRWYVYTILTGRYSGSPESLFDFDIKQISSRLFNEYLKEKEEAELSEAFWSAELIQNMNTSVASSPYYKVYLAAQVKFQNKGFLSRDILVRDLIRLKGDIHHLFPRKYLIKHGLDRGKYNQIANYVLMQQEINIKVGDKSPQEYFGKLLEQVNNGERIFGAINNLAELRSNLAMHCIPETIFNMDINNYDEFLAQRRTLMSKKIKDYYFSL